MPTRPAGADAAGDDEEHAGDAHDEASGRASTGGPASGHHGSLGTRVDASGRIDAAALGQLQHAEEGLVAPPHSSVLLRRMAERALASAGVGAAHASDARDGVSAAARRR